MKVPTPKKLPSGSWFIQLRLNGTSVPVTASTKKECIRTAEMIKAEYRAGRRAVEQRKSDVTLRQAIDHYIEAKSNSLSPSTIRGYRIIQRNRFQRYMDTPISNIKDWQAVYDSDTAAPKTLRNSFAFIRSVYQFETGKALPKIETKPVPKSERPFLDTDQIDAFLGAISGERVELPALLALSSLRCSELLDLTWDDIDLIHNRIRVHGAVVPDEHNRLVAKATNKTAASHRYVPIFIPQLRDALANVPKDQRTGSVVPYQTESGMIRAVNSICDKAGLPRVGLHGLRHSFASLCVHLGIPEETAMSIGGWSDFQTMRKIYTHISQRDKQEHVELLSGFFIKNANENANESEKP